MRVFLAATFVLVMLHVAVALSISSSPAARTETVLTSETGAPGVSEMEQCACVQCSTPAASVRFVETVVETELVRGKLERQGVQRYKYSHDARLCPDCMNRNAITHRVTTLTPRYGTPLKLPTDAAATAKDPASRVEVEVLGVGVCLWPDGQRTPENFQVMRPDLMM